ncbi:response regulator [Aciditerrimonas ferrireducens]|uniref:Response regulator n=1 Tax=Aciditerrimonas ferrireducens TaxID=667306 RepID=A0ABV6C3Q0_9ACTN
MRVLVVDDSRAMRMLIRRELRSIEGVEDVLEADSGQAAIAVLETEPIDLVLSDWNMPEMSGIELLTTLRAWGWPGRFAFLTSESGTATATQAAEAGASFLLTKPFSAEDLARHIARVFEDDSAPAPEAPAGAPAQRGHSTGEAPGVEEVLQGLLRRPVSARPAGPPRLEVARALARYQDHQGRVVALGIAEIAFAASAGAALSMLPPATAAEWAQAGVLTEAVAQNFHEVANVLSRVAHHGGAKCSLKEVTFLAPFEKPEEFPRIAEAHHQENLEITVQGYQAGRVGFVSLEP